MHQDRHSIIGIISATEILTSLLLGLLLPSAKLPPGLIKTL
jgi:hypothetical protein